MGAVGGRTRGCTRELAGRQLRTRDVCGVRASVHADGARAARCGWTRRAMRSRGVRGGAQACAPTTQGNLFHIRAPAGRTQLLAVLSVCVHPDQYLIKLTPSFTIVRRRRELGDAARRRRGPRTNAHVDGIITRRSSHYNAYIQPVRRAAKPLRQYQGEKRLQLDPPECSRMAETACTAVS